MRGNADEHVDPEMDGQEQDGPDWWRYIGVSSRASEQNDENFTALGDPARWGGDGIANIPEPASQANRIFTTRQLLYVQTKDPYSRNWQIVCNVGAEPAFWEAFDVPDQTIVGLSLRVMLGIGQINIEQQFNVNALLAYASPWYFPVTGGDGDKVLQYRPFVISGGLVARQVSARGEVFLGAAVTEGATVVAFQAIISPFAAGSGI